MTIDSQRFHKPSGSLQIVDAAPKYPNNPGHRQFYTRPFKCLICHNRLEFDTVDGATWVYCSCRGWRPHTSAHRLPMDVINIKREATRGVPEFDYE